MPCVWFALGFGAGLVVGVGIGVIAVFVWAGLDERP